MVLAGLVAAVFAISNGLPSIRDFYLLRAESIENVLLDITREQRLIEETTDWRDRRVVAETKAEELEAQIFSGGTVPIIEANIQSVISQHARDTQITVSSTRLAERLVTDSWLLIRQEMSFRTTDQSNTIQFLELLKNSTPRLWVTDYSLNRSRNQYSGSITVVGFARNEGLISEDSESRQ